MLGGKAATAKAVDEAIAAAVSFAQELAQGDTGREPAAAQDEHKEEPDGQEKAAAVEDDNAQGTEGRKRTRAGRSESTAPAKNSRK